MHKDYRLPEIILPKLTLTLPTPDFGCFDAEVLEGQPCGELPWSYVDETPNALFPSVFSHGTMGPIAAQPPLPRNISRDGTRLVGRPASLMAQDCCENAYPCSIADTPAVDDSTTRRLGNDLARLAQSVLRRLKLISWSGRPKKCHESTSKKALTRIFSIHSDQITNFRDSMGLGIPAEGSLKEGQIGQGAYQGPKPKRHSLISFVRRART